MELKEFIKQSLYDICTGISEANEMIVSELHNRPIAPRITDGKENPNQQQEIEFDIAITTSAKRKTSLKGDTNVGGIIKVVSAGAGGELGSEKAAESVSRIKFKIPFVPGSANKIPKN